MTLLRHSSGTARTGEPCPGRFFRDELGLPSFRQTSATAIHPMGSEPRRIRKIGTGIRDQETLKVLARFVSPIISSRSRLTRCYSRIHYRVVFSQVSSSKRNRSNHSPTPSFLTWFLTSELAMKFNESLSSKLNERKSVETVPTKRQQS